jgi:hypothetical protein
LLPAFAWDAKAASEVKKTAIRLGFIGNKDTGISDALKSVTSAEADLLAVLGDRGKRVPNEKKRRLGEQAIAAHRKFIVFVDGTLRSLAVGDPPHRAWTAYCDGAVKAANGKISLNSTYVANWS